ncbi:rhomboid family intramembrane serine protease [Paraglaciecola sp.]|uniref:rhomboid family intramembrane serine protease n=1 Tax=Paraglaciecola sp. TaxID=1920173 RepID=UPI003265B42E
MKLSNTSQQVKIVFWIFVILTIVEVINLFTGRMLNQLGNFPRFIPGLKGILLGPFIHGSLQHYFSNIIPICIFSYLLLQYGLKRYLMVTLLVVLGTGILVWLFGRSSSHIGASGIIYGYFGYLVLAGFLSGKAKLMLISVIVAFFYGGLIWGILPSSPYISWESHLFGFISGLVAAKLWASKAT